MNRTLGKEGGGASLGAPLDTGSLVISHSTTRLETWAMMPHVWAQLVPKGTYMHVHATPTSPALRPSSDEPSNIMKIEERAVETHHPIFLIRRQRLCQTLCQSATVRVQAPITIA
jgi:hypothetical protein